MFCLFERILENTDFTLAFNSLKESIMQSPFGGMIAMFGGESAIDGLKDSFIEKLQASIIVISKTETFQNTLNEALKNYSILFLHFLQTFQLLLYPSSQPGVFFRVRAPRSSSHKDRHTRKSSYGSFVFKAEQFTSV